MDNSLFLLFSERIIAHYIHIKMNLVSKLHDDETNLTGFGTYRIYFCTVLSLIFSTL
jgi:hypothetical protein